MKRGENEKWISMSMQEISYNMSNEKKHIEGQKITKKKERKSKRNLNTKIIC